MKKQIKRFDMEKEPQTPAFYLRPLAKLLCNGGYKKHKPIIHYQGTENIKAPFLLLCNHNAFQDFKVAYTLLGKNKANFVVAIDGFIGREWLLRKVGCICKRKFTNDIVLVKHLAKIIKKGNVAAIYPEARYSLCGTTAVLPKSIGKLAKFLKVPVVTLICNGHHVNSPFWNSAYDRGVAPTEATYKLLLTKEQVQTLDADEINKLIVKEFQYDDFKWQKDNKIEINDPHRAEGLHRVLYQCPNCGKEYVMESNGTKLKCSSCGKEWEMSPLGELKATDGKDIYTHIPDWYEWERANIRKEVEAGTYSSGELDCVVDSLPNAKKFIRLGKGKLIHDMNGFKVTGVDSEGDKFEMIKDVPSLYSCHIEYQYLFKHGDCIDLNTLEDTFYIYPQGAKFCVTKMAIATEELYRKWLIDNGKFTQEGIL